MASTTQWVTGQPCVWSHQYGWQLVGDVSTAPVEEPTITWDDLLGEEPKAEDDGKHWQGPKLHEMSRYWCTWHNAHGADPTHVIGKVWQCGSSAHSRASTPLEDKQVLDKIRMLHDTGLM
jgi:hypothetical protein